MGLLAAQVKHAEHMMTHAIAINEGIELTFADGCKGVIPFSDIPEIGDPSNLAAIELPNPYQVNIRGAKGETVELPWDFARHYCDSSYQSRVETIAFAGMQSLGKRIRSIREATGMKQSELATAAGIGRVTEVRIESGKQSPRYETLVMIAQALGRPTADLLTVKTILRNQSNGFERNTQTDESQSIMKRQAAKFEIFKDAKGEFRWRLIASNGQMIANGGEGYKTKVNAINSINSIKDNTPSATVEYKTA